MAFADTLIKRFRDAGLTVHDVRGQLPRKATWMTRPVSAINKIAFHHDAEWRPHSYDSLARIKAQANYHINKDWGGGARGDGLMYAFQVDNVGDVFITRDFEHVLWAVGDANYSTVSGCWHGTLGQKPTREQIEAMQKIAVVLTTKCPEFPAGRGQVLGHKEVPGNSTACNGEFLPATQQFRSEGNTHPERYQYDWPPVANPAPTPPKPVPEKPKWADIKGAPYSMIVNQDTSLFDATKGSAVVGNNYKKGQRIDNLVQEYVDGDKVYWRTKYSKDKNLNTSFKKAHLSPVPVVPPTPVPPTPTPTPTPTPPSKDDEQDKRIGALEAAVKGILELLKSIGQSIADKFK